MYKKYDIALLLIFNPNFVLHYMKIGPFSLSDRIFGKTLIKCYHSDIIFYIFLLPLLLEMKVELEKSVPERPCHLKF